MSPSSTLRSELPVGLEPLSGDAAVIFDLDDTLYKEADFARSGFAAVAGRLRARHGIESLPLMERLFAACEGRIFDRVVEEYGLPAEDSAALTELYRSHIPSIVPSRGAVQLLAALKRADVPVGVLTDGRSRTQRNKLAALGITPLLDAVVISEEIGSTKPDERNYLRFRELLGERNFWYVADNPRKDFVSCRKLGWRTICLKDDGRNIHPQRDDLDASYYAEWVIESLEELLPWAAAGVSAGCGERYPGKYEPGEGAPAGRSRP